MPEHTISGLEPYVASLSASTVTTVNLPAGIGAVAIVNRTTSEPITVNTNGEAPTVGGTKRFEYSVPAGGRLVVPLTPNYTNSAKLISAGTNEFHVSPAPDKLGGAELSFIGGCFSKAEAEAL